MAHVDPLVLTQLQSGAPLSADIARHLADCEVCRATAGATAAPPAGAGQRVREQATPLAQLYGMAPELAELFDVSHSDATGVLERAQRPRAFWIPLPFRGVSSRPIRTSGPRTRDARRFLLRMNVGARFPLHPHGRRERLLLLQGGVRDNFGREAWRGATLVTAPGEWHGFVALGDLPCWCAVLQQK